jgi:hypothetical protein
MSGRKVEPTFYIISTGCTYTDVTNGCAVQGQNAISPESSACG